jgi:DNA-binding NarL/FixJ family response regulator
MVMELTGLTESRKAVTINNLALMELDDGNLDRAQQLFEQALRIKRQIGEPRSIAISLVNLAEVLIKKGQWDAAEEALSEGLGMAAGSPNLIGTIRCNQGHVAAHRRNWTQAAEHYSAAIGFGRAGEHPDDVIEAMIGLCRVCQQTGRADEAAEHLREAQALATQIASPKWTARVQAAQDELAAGAATNGPAGGATSHKQETGRASPLPGNLTRRQADVLRMLAAGLSNKQIAAELYLSTATVERHLATIYAKLGVGGRVEAARFAIENGLDAPSVL